MTNIVWRYSNYYSFFNFWYGSGSRIWFTCFPFLIFDSGANSVDPTNFPYIVYINLYENEARQQDMHLYKKYSQTFIPTENSKIIYLADGYYSAFMKLKCTDIFHSYWKLNNTYRGYYFKTLHVTLINNLIMKTMFVYPIYCSSEARKAFPE